MKTSGKPFARIQRAAQIVILLASIAFLVVQLVQNGKQVQSEVNNLDWVQFLFATVLLILAWGLLALPTYLALKGRDISLSYAEALGVFNTSQLVKYLPGGLWALPGRMLLYQQRYQLKVKSALFLVLWETFALLVSAIVVGGLALSVVASPFLRLGWLVVVAASLVVIQFGRPQVAKIGIVKRLLSLAGVSQEETVVYTLPSSTVRHMVLATGLFWVITGIGFHYMVGSVLHSATSLSWVQSIGIYSLAWSIGFAVVFIPAGIGVREGALVFLLDPLMMDSEAIVIAILARLWWTIAEACWILAGLWLIRIRES